MTHDTSTIKAENPNRASNVVPLFGLVRAADRHDPLLAIADECRDAAARLLARGGARSAAVVELNPITMQLARCSAVIARLEAAVAAQDAQKPASGGSIAPQPVHEPQGNVTPLFDQIAVRLASCDATLARLEARVRAQGSRFAGSVSRDAN